MPKPHEYLYRIPTDGSLGQFQPPFENGARTVEIVNGSNQTLYFTDDTGYSGAIEAGNIATLGVAQSFTWRFQLAAAAATVNGNPPLVFALFYDTRRPTSGSFYTGPATGGQAVNIFQQNGVGAQASGDSLANPASFPEQNLTWVWNGASWDRQRTPNVFKNGLANAAGATTFWTPAVGKKFRLMKYRIGLQSTATKAVAGIIAVAVQDNATDIGQTFDVYVPAAAPNTTGEAWTTGWIDLGNGILSAAANNPLQLVLGSPALTAGQFRVIAIGTEE